MDGSGDHVLWAEGAVGAKDRVSVCPGFSGKGETVDSVSRSEGGGPGRVLCRPWEVPGRTLSFVLLGL